MCSVQYGAHDGDGSAVGGARVSGSGRAAVVGGVAEAVAVPFTLGCQLPKLGDGNCHARSGVRHSARDYQHSCGSAHGRRAVCALLWRGSERARPFALVHADVRNGANDRAGRERLL